MGNPNAEQSDQTSMCSHFSHPHPLQLSNTQALAPISCCSACKLEASGSVYSCTPCNFFLHPKCYNLPQIIKHEFDQNHVLSLQPKPVYPEGLFNCDACGNTGDGFSYHCSHCGTDLHSTCACLPMSFTHFCHQHPLCLTFSAPYPGDAFSCDICKRVSSKIWLYRCNACEFDVHLTCVATIKPSVSIQQRHIMVPGPQFTTSRSIPQPANVMNPPNMVVYGTPPRPPPVAMGPPQNQFVATPFPAAMTPVNSMPYINFSQPANYGPARPANVGPMDQLAVGAVNGIASGVAQAATQALLQGFMGGGGGDGGGGGGGVIGGNVSQVDAMGGGGVVMDGGSYCDSGYGGTDAGYSGGDGSYY